MQLLIVRPWLLGFRCPGLNHPSIWRSGVEASSLAFRATPAPRTQQPQEAREGSNYQWFPFFYMSPRRGDRKRVRTGSTQQESCCRKGLAGGCATGRYWYNAFTEGISVLLLLAVCGAVADSSQHSRQDDERRKASTIQDAPSEERSGSLPSLLLCGYEAREEAQ